MTTKISDDTKRVMAALMNKADSKEKKTTKRSTKKRRSSKKSVRKKSSKVTKKQIHKKVKDIVSKISPDDKPSHSPETVSEFSLSAFRKEIASGCKSCNETGYKNNYFCTCQNEICDGDFILWYDQFTYWYNSKVSFNFRQK